MTQHTNAKPELAKAKPVQSSDSQSKVPQSSREVPKPQSSSVLPPDFFDNSDVSKERSGKDLGWKNDVVCVYTLVHLKI